MIHLLRKRWGITTVKINDTAANPQRWPDGSYSVQDATGILGITSQTIFDWLQKGWLSMFGLPGRGKSHLAATIGLTLIENGFRVLFTHTSDLVQKLQLARRELALEGTIAKLDRYHLLDPHALTPAIRP